MCRSNSVVSRNPPSTYNTNVTYTASKQIHMKGPSLNSNSIHRFNAQKPQKKNKYRTKNSTHFLFPSQLYV